MNSASLEPLLQAPIIEVNPDPLYSLPCCASVDFS